MCGLVSRYCLVSFLLLFLIPQVISSDSQFLLKFKRSGFCFDFRSKKKKTQCENINKFEEEKITKRNKIVKVETDRTTIIQSSKKIR